ERTAGDGRLADAGRAADQDERAWHEAAAQNTVELADAGLETAHRRGPHLRERNRPQGAGSPRASGRRRHRPLLRQRVPFLAARAAPMPLGALVPALGADEYRGTSGHAPRVRRAKDDFAPG